MTFNSIDFLLFFPVVVMVYYIIPAKLKYVWLLISSYFFYICCDVRFIAYLLPITIFTYFIGLCLEKNQDAGKRLRKGLLAAAVVVILALLGILKYTDFFIANINMLISPAGLVLKKPEWNFILPLGFSFYSLQSLGYLIDVYRKKVPAEHNIIKYALFLSFFPILLSGPIERADHLLVQINSNIKLNMENIRRGLLTFVWGLYLKLVVADNLAIGVNQVITNYRSDSYKGCEIAVTTILFGLQIYCDFNGYSQMAIGSAKVLGIDVIHNFKAPYLAANVREFWRRWHISLTSWFTEYLYIPLGGNRKGRIRQYINILIVFGLSGLWHGASLNFVVWGLLNGMYLIIYDIYSKARKSKMSSQLMGDKIIKRIVTFLAVDFAWFFFMMPNLMEALRALKYAVINFNVPWIFSGSIFCMISGKWEFFVLLCSFLVMFLIDYAEYRNRDWQDMLFRQRRIVRWFVYFVVVIMIILCGVYGNDYQQKGFIYSNF